jgi:hypothetical protein
MKWKAICIMAVLGAVLLATPAWGQSAKDAYRALKKLEAMTQAGVSYRDYGPALGEAKLEVNLFLESPEAREKPRLREIFSKAMGHYEQAGAVWGYKHAQTGIANVMVPAGQGFSTDDSALIQHILTLYPSTRSKLDSMGGLRYSDALSAIWQEASAELKKAAPLMSLPDNAGSSNTK